MSIITPLQVPLSLYIHIPWCVQKCPYCDFNSHQVRASIPESDYIEALIVDLEQDLPLIWGRRIESIFIGGGTPSLFSPEKLHELLSAIRARIPVLPGAEITLEANPGTVERAKFKAFFELGINRLSIGVQSFQDAQLLALGRIHNAVEAREAIATAQVAGFENINIDLMFALPGQDVTTAKTDIEIALAAGVQHISYYQLTLEPNTVFYRRPPVLPNDDHAWLIQQQGQQLLQAAGYEQYEVSAFSQAGMQCRHNLNYWRFADYLGIGAGAHAKISYLAEGTIQRYSKLRHPQQYINSIHSPKRIQQFRQLANSDRILEFMMNALRLSHGFVLQEFEQSTGLAIAEIEPLLQQAEQKAWLKRDKDRVKTTALGSRFLDDVLQLYLTANT